MRGFVVIFALVFLSATPAFAGDRLQQHVDYLSSDVCGGRDVGTVGHDLARDYIVNAMKDAGLLPAGTEGWLVPVRIVRESRPSDESNLKIGTTVLAPDVEYRVADFSDGDLTGQPIFLGYGLHAPLAGWDDLGEHDVRNRTVIAFTGGPPEVERSLAVEDRYLLSDGSKAAVALSRGATAIVFINSPRTHGDGTGQTEDKLRALRPEFPLSGIGAARVTARAARKVFGQMGLDILQYQEKLDYGRPLSVEIPIDVTGVLRLERTIVTGHNVVGKLGGGEGPPVVLGAHYDHLGMGGPASNYQGPPRLHPGADDNASGVAVMLETAWRLRNDQPARPVYFAALTGEERALRGSRTLARVLVDRRAGRETTFVNLDMVGRLGNQKLRVYAQPNTESLRRVLDGATRVRLTLERLDLEAAHSDHVPFAELGFESIGFSTGHHRDYHRPSDTPGRLDWQGMRAVADLVAASIRALAND